MGILLPPLPNVKEMIRAPAMPPGGEYTRQRNTILFSLLRLHRHRQELGGICDHEDVIIRYSLEKVPGVTILPGAHAEA